MATNMEIIKKSGSWFSYEGAKLAQGREAALNILKDNLELQEEVEAKVRERFAATIGEAPDADVEVDDETELDIEGESADA